MTTDQGNPTGSAEIPATETDTLDADLTRAFEENATDDTGSLTEAARTLRAARQAKAAPAKETVDTTKPEATEKVEKTDKTEKTEVTEPEKKDEVEAPAHWPAADRELFAKQAPEAKQWLLGRYKAMEADYTKKTQELGGMRRMKETLDEVFAPFRDQMQMNGVDEAMAIRQLVGAHAFLQRDPNAAIQKLAEQYGINLKAIVEGNAAADPAGESPVVKGLREQVAKLTDQIAKVTGHQGEQQLHARLNEVTQFAEEKDAQGNLKRPHFDDVAPVVATMIRAAKTEGKALTLQEAYDSAVWANPQTRAKVLAAQDAQRRAKEEEDRKAKANAARKAGFEVKGEGAATSVVAKNDSIEASLEAAWDAAAGRV